MVNSEAGQEFMQGLVKTLNLYYFNHTPLSLGIFLNGCNYLGVVNQVVGMVVVIFGVLVGNYIFGLLLRRFFYEFVV